ncbi:hypothetical protein PSTT_08549 [Puccinia striiformis]|uniref:RanBP2-type domain-containing protein n=1 Tax=Puccinia striiformis TaxID=27350 RepID=A0A2S4VBY3_9BASI|nr:hypothetical protein PSTT_08549 [Puccinia striiformis]
MEFNLANPNSQSFDEVLEKLKQSMKAARSGGWIDSDSGSELEIALEHSPHGGQADGHHPTRNGSTPRSINNHQHSLYLKDGISGRRGEVEEKAHANLDPTPAPLLTNQKSDNARAVDYPNLKTRPLTLASLNHHSSDHPASFINHEPRHSPLFDAPNSSYVPRTPSTPVSAGTSAGSPYVRHHFKWEYLAPSTTVEGAHQPGSQPRFVESSSPPHNINLDENYWQKAFHQKEFTFPPEVPQFRNPTRHSHERQPSLNATNNLAFATRNGHRSVSYSPAQSKTQSPSQQNFGSGFNGRMPTMELSSNNIDSFNQPAFEPSLKPWAIPLVLNGIKSFNHRIINPASVSSVPFSLAPAAPIRFSAPETNGQSKGGNSAREASSRSPIRENDASISSRDATSVKAQSVISASASSASLQEERDKQAIRARLMGSASIDNFQTRPQTFNRPFGAASPPVDGGHSGQVGNLPSLFHQLRFSNSAQPMSAAQSRVHSSSESFPLRSISATFPMNHSYGNPVFYSSNPQGPVLRHGPFTTASIASLPKAAPSMPQLASKTSITPIGYGVDGPLHSPNSSVPYSPVSSVNNSPFVPVVAPTVSGIGGPVSSPLPGQVQPEEVRKSVKTQPPVVNTGNSGAMVPQPGDWMCICGFVNWRRRKVCMRCFPFADGNDSVGAMMALNAQRAALLAAGGQLTDSQSNGAPAISNPSAPVFQRPPIPSFHDPVRQSNDKQPPFDQVFSSSESVFDNYEPAGIFNSQPQRVGLNPFDKSSPFSSLNSNSAINPNSSPNGARSRFLGATSEETMDRDVIVNSAISRPEKATKALRARLVAPGEETQAERTSWEDVLSKSPRPRSFSMGAKSVWEPDEETEKVGTSNTPDISNLNNPENSPIGKETNGTSGSEDASVGSQVVSGRLALEDRHQELNTINQNGSNINRQRTTTSPASSWQAIKVLWE